MGNTAMVHVHAFAGIRVHPEMVQLTASRRVDLVGVGDVDIPHFAVVRDLSSKKWLMSNLDCSDKVCFLQLVLMQQDQLQLFSFSASKIGSRSVAEQCRDVFGTVHPVV